MDSDMEEDSNAMEDSFILSTGQDVRQLTLQELLEIPVDILPCPSRGRPRKGSVQEYLGKKKVYSILKQRKALFSRKSKVKSTPTVAVSNRKHVNYREGWCSDPAYQVAISSANNATTEVRVGSEWTSIPAYFQSKHAASTNTSRQMKLSNWLHKQHLHMEFLSVDLNITFSGNESDAISVAPFCSRRMTSQSESTSVVCVGDWVLNTCAPITSIQPIYDVSIDDSRQHWLVIGFSRIGWPSLTDSRHKDYEYAQNSSVFGDDSDRVMTLSNTDGFAADFIRPLDHCRYAHSNLLQIWRFHDVSGWKLAYFVGLEQSGHIRSIHAVDRSRNFHAADTLLQSTQLVALLQGNGRVEILLLPLSIEEDSGASEVAMKVVPSESLRIATLSAETQTTPAPFWISAFVWLPRSSSRCVTGMSDGSCWLWDASTAQILRKFGDRAVMDRRTPILAAVTALQFCPYSLGSLSDKSSSGYGQSKEEFLAVGSEDGAIRLWQIPVESDRPGPSSLSSSASTSENNSRWNMFGSLENPVATFDVGTDVCHLQWDRTGQGLFYTTSESEEVNWLRLWSSFSSKRSSFFSRIEVSKTFGNQMVTPFGRTLSFATISNTDKIPGIRTDGIPYVYAGGSDGSIRGGFVPTLLSCKEPGEDGFGYLQVLSATPRQVYDSSERGQVTVSMGFNLKMQPMHFAPSENHAQVVEGGGDDTGNIKQERRSSQLASDSEVDGDEEEDDDDTDDAETKRSIRKPKSTRGKADKPNPVLAQARKEVWYDSRVMVTVVDTLPAKCPDGGHVVVCGLQCGLVLLLPPHSLIELYDIPPRSAEVAPTKKPQRATASAVASASASVAARKKQRSGSKRKRIGKDSDIEDSDSASWDGDDDDDSED